MSNIIPLTLKPHIVSFLIKEMKGEMNLFAGYKCKIFDIPRKSFIGKYLLENLEKINYPVKNIESFNFFVEIIAASRNIKKVTTGQIYKREKLGETFVYLPEKYIEDINMLFEDQFRTYFMNFVDSRSEDDLMISQSIILFIDKYDLFESGVSQLQLRRLYYRIKKNGISSGFQGKLYQR